MFFAGYAEMFHCQETLDSTMAHTVSRFLEVLPSGPRVATEPTHASVLLSSPTQANTVAMPFI